MLPRTPIHLRTLLVRARPAPVTLAERRAVLMALQRTGPVEVFRHLPATPAAPTISFVTVAESLVTARRLVRDSPAQFRVVIPSALGGHASTAQTRLPLWGVALKPAVFAATDADDDGAGDEMARLSSSDRLAVDVRFLTLTVSPFPEYRHRTAIRSSPLYWPWPCPVDEAGHGVEFGGDSLESRVLRESIPAGVAARALSRWTTQDVGVGGVGQPLTGSVIKRTLRKRRIWETENLLPAAMAMARRGGAGGGAEGVDKKQEGGDDDNDSDKDSDSDNDDSQ